MTHCLARSIDRARISPHPRKTFHCCSRLTFSPQTSRFEDGAVSCTRAARTGGRMFHGRTCVRQGHRAHRLCVASWGPVACQRLVVRQRLGALNSGQSLSYRSAGAQASSCGQACGVGWGQVCMCVCIRKPWTGKEGHSGNSFSLPPRPKPSDSTPPCACPSPTCRQRCTYTSGAQLGQARSQAAASLTVSPSPVSSERAPQTTTTVSSSLSRRRCPAPIHSSACPCAMPLR